MSYNFYLDQWWDSYGLEIPATKTYFCQKIGKNPRILNLLMLLLQSFKNSKATVTTIAKMTIMGQPRHDRQ